MLPQASPSSSDQSHQTSIASTATTTIIAGPSLYLLQPEHPVFPRSSLSSLAFLPFAATGGASAARPNPHERRPDRNRRPKAAGGNPKSRAAASTLSRAQPPHRILCAELPPSNGSPSAFDRRFVRHHNGGNKKAPKAKSGKSFHQPYHPRQNNDNPKDNVLLHRLSQPSSSPSGTLLERIGGSVEDEAASILTDSDRIDGARVVDIYSDLPFSATPHFYTPEPGEVERFLESVIGAPPAASAPSSPVHACSWNKPTLALETYNLHVDHLVRDPSSSVSYSPTQTAVNSLPSANLTLDHFYQQSPLLGETMAPPPTSTIEECKKHLIPVLLASAQARGPGKRLDSEQCLRLLSDDQCRKFFRKAKEMRLQLSSLVSQKTPMSQGWSGSLKRDRVDEVDTWVRNTRSRCSSMNTVVSDVSRRDSDITLVDFTGGRLPPKAPRAMLQASQTTLIRSDDNAQDEAPYEALEVASPTTEDHPVGSSLIELVRQAIKMFPTLVPPSQPVIETDTPNVSVGQSTGDQSGHPSQMVSLTHSTSSSSTDFVSHLPTQPGIWFKQLGRQYAEIVDIDIEVSDEMFYMSKEQRPFRLRMHLRLCSVSVGATMNNNSNDKLASLQDIDGIIGRHAHHWPKKGKLVVQVNPESERSKTWLPYTLELDPLDVTSCMRPGKNTFRFIQLSDLSEFTFVLVASMPPPEEEWRSWDWASLVERSRTKSSSTDDPTNDLSEFAHLPIVVRS
ncbi:hypothetical protein J3R83DRAFT_1293 [Lanmaoa asiatica]|nr:hypothetical protein J3R83DRAFT_1293 [Lanmaoa asiatica]